MSNIGPAAYTLSLFTYLITSSFFLMAEESSKEGVALDNVYITGGKDSISRKPGSATLIDDIALESFEYTDIHRVLNAVPGVNLQEEDGYGLRPNIGLRGTSPERSKKITVMEDGILSGPAPYSAPAAYYFPNISRMAGVEVFKGPSTIQYGPATVGGAINLVSRAIPYSATGELDVQYGSHDFQRYNAYYGEQIDNVGYLIEGLRVSAGGFKELDGKSKQTGFVRNDINLKSSWQVLGASSHLFQMKLGYADEDSNETYLGLTRDDFDNNPYRRYSASQLDNTEWQHQQIQLSHQFENDNIVISSDVYRNNFTRDWFKVNNFKNSSVSLQNVLEDPDNTVYDDYYNVLTGDAASTPGQELLIGNNGRTYISQGIQTRINSSVDWISTKHEIEVGLRYHQDEVKRLHTEQDYNTLVGGALQAVDGTFKTTTDNEADSRALAIYIQDEISFSDTTVTIGARHENIVSTKTTYGNTTGIKEQKDTIEQSILLPGIGVYSQLSQDVGVLAGIYKGFTAATAGGSGNIEPELSTNYELGTRFSGNFGQSEVIAFLNDYSQFSGTCSFAQGSCDSSATGVQQNAGSAIVAGVEASWSNEIIMSAYLIPMSLSYTYSYGEFGEDFVDSTGAFGKKGQKIEKGYRIGYLPEHRLNAQVGIAEGDWKVNTSLLYQSETRNIPGVGSIPKADLVEAHMIVDISASYQYMSDLQFYSTLDNLLDEQYVAGVKPYGFRPGKPRSINVGAKYSF